MKICRDYRREGSCRWGKRCKYKFSHCLDPGVGFTPAPQAALVSPLSYVATVSSPSRVAIPREACHHWDRRGNCKFGDDCDFDHDPSNARPPEVCRKFLKHGDCRYGDTCKYYHVAHIPRTAGQAAPSQGTSDHPQSAAEHADQTNRDSSCSGTRASGGSGDTPYQCIVCQCRPVSVIYDSCKHVCLCQVCHDSNNPTLSQCPLCRVYSGRSNVFLAGVS